MKKTIKSVVTLFTMGLVIAAFTGCGGTGGGDGLDITTPTATPAPGETPVPTGTPAPGDPTPTPAPGDPTPTPTPTPDSVSIKITGSGEEGDIMTFEATTNIKVVSYEWSGEVSGNTKIITDSFAAGSYSATVKVMAADDLELTTVKSFVITDKVRTMTEMCYDLDDLGVGDSFYESGGRYVKTDTDCEYSLHNGAISAPSFVISPLKHLHTIAADGNGDLGIIMCSLDGPYDSGMGYKDMAIIEIADDGLWIRGYSNHSDPDDPRWLLTRELFCN